MLVLRTFQDGDPHFPREVLHAMKRGAKILNLSNFRDDSSSSPWDYTAFVRTFALYLDERLDCFITGKLQRRFTYKQRDSIHQISRGVVGSPVHDMKPTMLLDRISYWQRLLDRAIGTRPSGAAKTNRLVLITLYAIVQESFDLYRDISDGLALLLDSFFHLKYQACVRAFQACVRAKKQYEELSSFYDLCKSVGVGRTSEYPSVQKISDELIETLQEFLKDQATFPSHNGTGSQLLLMVPSPKDPASNPERFAQNQLSVASERFRRRGYSGFTSRSTSLEHLMSLTDPGTSPSTLIEQVGYSEEQFEKRSPCLEDFLSTNYDSGSNCSLPLEQGKNSSSDLVGLDDDRPQDEGKQQQERQPEHETSETISCLESAGPRDGWELVLIESANEHVQPSKNLANGFESSVLKDLFKQTPPAQHLYNPFLQDILEARTNATTINEPSGVPEEDGMSSVPPVFQAERPTFCTQMEAILAEPPNCAQTFDETTAVPTFCAKSTNETIAVITNGNDPFATCPGAVDNRSMSNGSMNQSSLLREQQLWLEHQNKIIAKRMT